MTNNWPLTADAIKAAPGFPSEGQHDNDELEKIAIACCNRVDGFTGRKDEPTLHEDADGNLPPEFELAALDLAVTWWQQTRNGPRMSPTGPGGPGNDPASGIRGIGWPRKAKAMLEDYEALPGFS